jgi:hypothetical protein
MAFMGFLLRMDFFSKEDAEAEVVLGNGDLLYKRGFSLPSCNGPYSQVTLHSFCLLYVRKMGLWN